MYDERIPTTSPPGTPGPGGVYGHSSSRGVRRLGAGVGLAVLLFLLGFVGHVDAVIDAQTAVIRGVSGLRNPVFTAGAELLTVVLEPELWAVIGVLGPVVLFLLHRRGAALRVFCVLIGSIGVAFVAKHLVGEHRPDSSLWVSPPGSDGSFPSGHTTAACAVVVGVVLLVPVAARRAVLIAGAVLIVLVASVRVYLGVHYPLDTVGGMLCAGCATVFLSGLAVLPPGRRWLLALDRSPRARPAMAAAPGPPAGPPPRTESVDGWLTDLAADRPGHGRQPHGPATPGPSPAPAPPAYPPAPYSSAPHPAAPSPDAPYRDAPYRDAPPGGPPSGGVYGRPVGAPEATPGYRRRDDTPTP